MLASREDQLKSLAEDWVRLAQEGRLSLTEIGRPEGGIRLATFLNGDDGESDVQFHEFDLAIVLRAPDICHAVAQRVLSEQGARFRLIGIEQADNSLSPHEADLLLAAYGPAVFKIPAEEKGNSVVHVSTTTQRINTIADGCQFKQIGDIQAGRVSAWLKERRDLDGTKVDGRTIRFGIASSNHHLTAVKGFTRWLVRNHRCGDDALSHLSRLNAKTDIRRERRHLTIDDFSKLIEATRRNADRVGLSGPDRAELYFVAGYTGLRASELASLTESSFDLDDGTVTVEAAYSKHRKRDVLPLPSAVVTRLREWFQERRDQQAEAVDILTIKNVADDAQGPLWPGTWASRRHGADMLRFDLLAAESDHVDDSGKVFDFHALRHQFISMLAASGVHPKTAQQLARHSATST